MGWVLTSQEPMIIEDVTRDPRFDREVAERLGYVPKHMMSVPLLHDEEALGVLNVLDRRERSFSSAEEMDLLGTFASQAAIALSVVRAGKRAKRMLEEGAGDAAVVARLAATIDRLEGPKRAAATQLLEALDAPDFGVMNAGVRVTKVHLTPRAGAVGGSHDQSAEHPPI